MKRETIYLLSGRLKVFYGVSPEKLECTVYGPGEYLTLAPTMVHRMEAEENCIYLEASTPEMMDVVRLDDDYRRAVS